LSEGLLAMGADPVVVPVLEVRAPEFCGPLDDALWQLESFDWLILTSVNAVAAVTERCALLGVAVGAVPVAAVGRVTAEAARSAGFDVRVVPQGGSMENSEGVVEALRGLVDGNCVLLPRAAAARDVIPEELAAAGAAMTVVEAYRMGIPEGAVEGLREALREGVDVAAFTSSSSVRHLAEVAREAGIGFPLEGAAGLVKAVSIGPVTSGTLREFGWEPAAEAERPEVESLVYAVVKARDLV
jgi:uroporphyrinogen-III synthase